VGLCIRGLGEGIRTEFECGVLIWRKCSLFKTRINADSHGLWMNWFVFVL